jgi:hypothetical protein
MSRSLNSKGDMHEGKEKERRGFGVAAARDGHGDHLEALIDKRLGLEEEGALSPSPQGGSRRRKQGARRFRVTKGEIQLLQHFGEPCIFLLQPLVWINPNKT